MVSIKLRPYYIILCTRYKSEVSRTIYKYICALWFSFCKNFSSIEDVLFLLITISHNTCMYNVSNTLRVCTSQGAFIVDWYDFN